MKKHNKKEIPRWKYLTLNLYLTGMLILEWLTEFSNLDKYKMGLKMRGNAFMSSLELFLNNNIFQNLFKDRDTYNTMINGYKELIEIISTFSPTELAGYIKLAKAYENELLEQTNYKNKNGTKARK